MLINYVNFFTGEMISPVNSPGNRRCGETSKFTTLADRAKKRRGAPDPKSVSPHHMVRWLILYD